MTGITSLLRKSSSGLLSSLELFTDSVQEEDGPLCTLLIDADNFLLLGTEDESLSIPAMGESVKLDSVEIEDGLLSTFVDADNLLLGAVDCNKVPSLRCIQQGNKDTNRLLKS